MLRGDHKFVYKKLLGRGTFGEVYMAVSEQNGQEVAIKKEIVDPEEGRWPGGRSLAKEFKILKYLEGGIGIPRAYSFVQGERNVMVFECLGQDVSHLLANQGGRFSLKTVLMLADQMLSRLEYLHSNGIIHRDIKPQNFTMGMGSGCHIVYLIDYGLVTFKDPNVTPALGYGAERKKNPGRMVGTARFASVNAHKLRDDIESLLYVLVFLLKGRVPWQGMGERKPPFSGIRKSKEQTKPMELFQGFPIANELDALLQDCRTNRVSPPYAGARKSIRSSLHKMGEVLDWQFDWIVEAKKNEKKKTN
ncbi:hypothetical protein AAMO2058_000489600 [Amorphochlora amoebiformis]|mmetsp:Transcript_12274/g.19455  ORF Transcript_12274/g.19455 Transcript_12274/m.19455 type:complete len:305 (-) Transcript_12274:102-1016(-)